MLATAAGGRVVVVVSGSHEAVVCVTAGADQQRTSYLRLRAEARGTPVSGLPADAQQVLTRG